ncbi:hypothetical protein FN846DRAFT_808753 [Sphaerosporella brunnea]|uniref:C2H2-type domain-containing protein n=1 Tax=Sphaerosporella brunnea TaxID=1250544 RepID=A0A5J5F4D3_9PEZI|nr:hypothetical protein FN846DRAFT_808753 [Sphaerosporella brunnea]
MLLLASSSSSPPMSKRPRSASPPPPSLPETQIPSPPHASDTPDNLPAKFSRVDAAATAQLQPAIICSEKPLCQARPFSTYEEYESHYAKTHTNRCVECMKNFPSERFLHLHIKETHDMLSQIKLERGEKIFGCFVDGCDRMCSTPFKRKRHLIDKHRFPRNYNFFVTKDGIDRTNSLLVEPSRIHRSNHDHRDMRGGRSETPSSTAQLEDAGEDTVKPSPSGMVVGRVAQTGPDEDFTMNEISGLMSAMRFIPTTVRFGRRR